MLAGPDARRCDVGILSSVFRRGRPCERCGSRSPLTGKGSRWVPVAGAPGRVRCGTCGHEVVVDPAPAATPAPVRQAPIATAAPAQVFTPDNSIHLAAEVGDVARVRRFIEQGESPSSPDPVGLQPLHYASNKGRLDVMRFLIERGADPNAQGEQGLAPLHGAAYHGSTDAIAMLVDRGANVNIRTSKNFTPLAIARLTNQAEAAALIERLGGIA